MGRHSLQSNRVYIMGNYMFLICVVDRLGLEGNSLYCYREVQICRRETRHTIVTTVLTRNGVCLLLSCSICMCIHVCVYMCKHVCCVLNLHPRLQIYRVPLPTLFYQLEAVHF